MIHVLTIALVFSLALTIALLRGIGWAYTCVFLPALLLLNQIPSVNLQHAPVFVEYAPFYAILIALPFRQEALRFRVCSTDVVIGLLLVSATITAWSTELFETGVNTFRNDLLRLGMPYFLGRIVFRDWRMRRVALNVLIAVLALISVCALIEFRAQPYFYDHMLQKIGMGNSVHSMAYGRFGFYRVSGPVEHPIFFGNMCVAILGMVTVLACTSGRRLSSIPVGTALFAAFGCVIVSISFTPYVGMIVGTMGLLTLVWVPLSRRLVLPLTVAVFFAGWAYTYHVATSPLGEKGETQLEGSLYTRKLIMHESWSKVTTAGPFGYGLRPDFSDDDDFDLISVDNSYMQLSMTRGWVYIVLWICIGLSVAYRMGRAFRIVTDPAQVFPLAVCTATVLGLMASMYTVWAGALYVVVWMVMLGLTTALLDAVLHGAEAPASLPSAFPLRPPTVRLPVGVAALR